MTHTQRQTQDEARTQRFSAGKVRPAGVEEGTGTGNTPARGTTVSENWAAGAAGSARFHKLTVDPNLAIRRVSTMGAVMLKLQTNAAWCSG